MDREDSPVYEDENTDLASPDIAPDTQPATTPLAPVQPAPTEANSERSSPGVIVLQWLTYAFWGWLIIALIWLMGVVTVGAIADADVSDIIPYAIAATLVLLPIAFVTDLFYRRYEPAKKTGAATVIMVIHVVIFALLGIGALITTVFTVLSMFIGTGSDTEEQTAAVITELFAAALYVAVFLRTLNPFKTKKFARIYGFAMLGVTVIALVLGVVGPMLKAVSERDDRRIETNLPLVQSSISTYVDDNKKLPDTLKDITYRDNEARSLIDDGLVRYEKVSTPTQKSDQIKSLLNDSTEYRYKLCVTYKGSSNESDYDYSYRGASYSNEYDSYLSVYSHPAGEVCYKLSASAYNLTITD
ncbi:MAG: hypothetical protein JWM00_225 [Candidatus Saccharibacteria bacterium]|nr:hypothetical protein [Candidatus Saccharibacteria bacterium]